MGVMLAVIEISKLALGFIAGVELVTLLFIIYTLFFEKKMIYFLSTFILLEGILNGFNIWWLAYIYIWSLLVLVTYLFKEYKKYVFFWSLLSGIFGLMFGVLYCPIYFITNGINTGIAWWIAGLPTDLIHGISNFVLCVILFRPLNNILGKLRKL